MAVLSVKRLGRSDRSSQRDGRIIVHQVFQVILDDPAGGALAALFADDGTRHVPAYGELIDAGGPYVCIGKDAQTFSDTGTHWEVSCEFATPTRAEVQRWTAPIDRDVEFGWEYAEKTEEYFKDINDKPVVNSAGEPFDVNPTREAGELVIHLTRNQYTFDAAFYDGFRHTINEYAVVLDGTTYAPGTLKLSPVNCQKVTESVANGIGGSEQDVTYYKLTFTFKARADGWKDYFPDVGYNELDSGGKLKEIQKTTPPGRVDKPYPLDGLGAKKANPTDVPAELEFEPYEEMDWAPLGF
jgi:hypothetical protein